MKVLPLFAIAAFAITAGAQTASGNGSTDATAPHTNVSQSAAAAASRSGVNEAGSAAAQSRHLTGSASQATNVSAELARSIDSKHAKVGDPVEAKTTRKALLADGTKLPKGTKLIGHVTEVSRKTKAHKTSHLGFAFDHAILRNGREVPIHAVLRSLSAPAPMVGADGDLGGDAGMGGGMVPAGGGGAVRGGGGLLGGASRGVVGGGSALAGGALRTGGNAAGGAANSLVSTTSGASGEMNAATSAGGRNLGGALGGGANTSAQGQLIPVGNMRGVSFFSGSNAASSATFQGHGRNVDLSSGSTMSLAVSAQR